MSDLQQQGFRALADPTRRDILIMLAQKEMTIAEVAENFDMTRAAVKKHLTVLQHGNLISVRTDGRTRVNALRPEGVRHIFDWFTYFDAFWDERLTAMKTSIEKDIQ